MALSLGELFIELGVFADSKELKDFENKLKKINKTMQDAQKKSNKATKSISSFLKGIAGVATAITTAAYAMQKLTNSLVANNQEFLNLTRTSDIALGTFQKWGNVGRMLGVKNAAQQIEHLNQTLFKLKLTGEGASGFILGGINPYGQDAEGIMEQLRNRVANMSDTSASYLLQQMGIDPTMLHLLRLGRKEFEELGQAVNKYQLTPEQTKQIQEMNVQLQIAQIKLEYLKNRVILALMPHWVNLVKSFARVTGFLSKSKVGIIAVSTAITASLIPAIKKVFTTLFMMVKTHPVIAAFTALFTGLYLIIDDIVGYMKGEKSITGIVLQALEDFKQNGFFSDDVPKWIEMLARAADTLEKIHNEGFIKGFLKSSLGVFTDLKTPIPPTFAGLKILTILGALQAKQIEEAINASKMVNPNTSTINSNIDNRRSQNTVNMQNQFYTQQPAMDIQNTLYPLQYNIFGTIP